MHATARLGLAAGLLLCAPAAPAALELGAVQAERTARTIALSLELELRDPGGRVARALLRGDVWLTVDIALYRQPRWWQAPRAVGRLRLLRRLAYEPQRRVYRVHDINRDERADFDDLDGCKAYLAGPPVMVEAATEMLRIRDIRDGDIHADAFYTEAEKAALNG